MYESVSKTFSVCSRMIDNIKNNLQSPAYKT